MKYFTRFYLLFLPLFLVAFIYMVINMNYSRFDSNDILLFYISNAVSIGVWFVIGRLLAKENTSREEKERRIYRSFLYAVIIAGIALIQSFELPIETEVWVFPLILFGLGFAWTYWLHLNTMTAHLFMISLCLALIIGFNEREGSLFYRLLYALSSEGIKEGVQIIWPGFFILYGIQSIVSLFEKWQSPASFRRKRPKIKESELNKEKILEQWSSYIKEQEKK